MHELCVMRHQYIMVAAVCTALHNVTLPKVGAACMLAFSAVMLQSSEQAWSCRLIWTSWRGSLTLKTQKKKTSPSDSQHCLRFASTCAMHPADFHLLTRCVILSSQHWLRTLAAACLPQEHLSLSSQKQLECAVPVVVHCMHLLCILS